jgi:hypothetical protein
MKCLQPCSCVHYITSIVQFASTIANEEITKNQFVFSSFALIMQIVQLKWIVCYAERFSFLQAAAGNAFCYFLFSGVALSGVLFVVFILPETKGGRSRLFVRKIFASYIPEYVLFYFGEMLPPSTWRNTHTSWPHPLLNHSIIRTHLQFIHTHP